MKIDTSGQSVFLKFGTGWALEDREYVAHTLASLYTSAIWNALRRMQQKHGRGLLRELIKNKTVQRKEDCSNHLFAACTVEAGWCYAATICAKGHLFGDGHRGWKRWRSVQAPREPPDTSCHPRPGDVATCHRHAGESQNRTTRQTVGETRRWKKRRHFSLQERKQKNATDLSLLGNNFGKATRLWKIETS